MTAAHSVFEARAFNPSLGNEVVSGKILLDRWHLRFESGSIRLEIAFANLHIEIDDAAQERVCLSSDQLPGWTIFPIDAAILEDYSFRQHDNIRNQISEIYSRRELKRRLKLTLAFVAICGLMATALVILSGIMVRSIVARIPADFEAEVGDSLLEDLKGPNGFNDDPKLMTRVNQAVNPMLSRLPGNGTNFDFHIIEEPTPNACALPGGHVVITTGLLEVASRPEEIAGVVAHELAHEIRKHSFRQLFADMGPLIICRVFLGGGRGITGAIGNGSELLIQRGFSQEYEMEADAVGWQYLVDAHIDPRGFIDILKKLKAEQDRTPHGHVQIQAFSTHPATEKRIKRLEAKWKKLKNKSNFIDLRNQEAK